MDGQCVCFLEDSLLASTSLSCGHGAELVNVISPGSSEREDPGLVALCSVTKDSYQRLFSTRTQGYLTYLRIQYQQLKLVLARRLSSRKHTHWPSISRSVVVTLPLQVLFKSQAQSPSSSEVSPWKPSLCFPRTRLHHDYTVRQLYSVLGGGCSLGPIKRDARRRTKSWRARFQQVYRSGNYRWWSDVGHEPYGFPSELDRGGSEDHKSNGKFSFDIIIVVANYNLAWLSLEHHTVQQFISAETYM